MVMMMRPFGNFFYSGAHRSVHMKWRVATHSDHSCCGRVSEGPRCCNLICLSCKVKAFIISARGIRCHLHWTWHAPPTMGDHTHTHTHTHTHKCRYTSQTMGDKVERWRLWGRDGQKDSELMADGRAKVSQLDFAVVVKVMGAVGGEGTHTHTHTHGQKANGKWLRSDVQQGGESDGGNEGGDWWESVCLNQTLCDVICCTAIYSSLKLFPLTFFFPPGRPPSTFTN